LVPRADLTFYKEGDEVPILHRLRRPLLRFRRSALRTSVISRPRVTKVRRPLADLLRDNIYELRPSCQGVHYRILYFFSSRNVVVVSHGLKKESEVPAVEIKRAIERKKRFEADPKAHTFRR
jgi:phage-related protein